jgi:hypothetical protein
LFRQILLMKISLMKEMHSDECDNVEHIEKKLEMIDVLMAGALSRLGAACASDSVPTDLNNYIEISSLKQTTELVRRSCLCRACDDRVRLRRIR